MNDSSYFNSIPNRNQNNNTHLTDRLLSIYSLFLIIIGTPANLLCCVIYLQRSNRSNSIKTLFGYLAFLDAIVPFTFNLNYVFREFNVHVKVTYLNPPHNNHNKNGSATFAGGDQRNALIIKKNLEEHSLFLCRFLSYLAFSTLQTSSWVLAFGSLNRYLLVTKLRNFEFICRRRYTMATCFLLTVTIFFGNTHIFWMNGYRSSSGHIECYKNAYYPNYMLWYQRLHLFIYSVVPSLILFVFNVLLMRIIFASKKRLDNHKRLVLFAAAATTTLPTSRRRSFLALQQSSASALRRTHKNSPSRLLHRHSRKLTMSLIFIAISFFILTIPSTVIFSFVRPYIRSPALRRTLSLLFTNLATTTHVIRFFIYFFCSIDFRNDFYRLLLLHRSFGLKLIHTQKKQRRYQTTVRWKHRESFIDRHNK